MAMSDCIDCWETPCCCGTGYEDWSLKRIDEQIQMLQRVRERKERKLLEAVFTTPKI